jgi:tetratricopeptide (TPR) repeat protein
MFSVGQDVRVLLGDGGSSRRGTIMVKNTDDSYEVLLTVGDGAAGEEEIVMTADRIAPLYSFETEPTLPLEAQYAEVWKNNGNVLFTAKDYSAALGYYQKALSCLRDNSKGSKFAMGDEVIISYQNSINYKSGMVSDADSDARTADVMLEGDEDEEEECGVAFDRLLPLAKDATQQLLQRSIYLNMARCVLKQELKGWAIKYSSIAICITHAYISTARQQGVTSSKEEQSKLLADCYYFRAKALLAACRPKFAAQVIKLLSGRL